MQISISVHATCRRTPKGWRISHKGLDISIKRKTRELAVKEFQRVIGDVLSVTLADRTGNLLARRGFYPGIMTHPDMVPPENIYEEVKTTATVWMLKKAARQPRPNQRVTARNS